MFKKATLKWKQALKRMIRWERIKPLLPVSVIALHRKMQRKKTRFINRFLTRKKVFSRIYAHNEWGGEQGTYCSGDGSSVTYAEPYAKIVREFIAEKHIETVVDLGCGDFTVGNMLQVPDVMYCGVDVVDSLTERNKCLYNSPFISFCCLDIVSDILPKADLCLIRQVLQHLSNKEIISILQKTREYKFTIITEHYPAPDKQIIPNKDKPHGEDVRIYDGSGVFIDKPPFNININAVLLELPIESPLVCKGETIKTFLIVKQDTQHICAGSAAHIITESRAVRPIRD
jgi:hypothetical protein